MAQVIIYVAVLMLGQAIPKEWVYENVVKSYKQLDEIGLYYDVVEGAQWDNWTDTYFLNAAITQYDGNLLEQALANSYTVSVNTDRKVLDDLSAAIYPQEQLGLASYSRYWAGNLTFYKILLIFMPISGIRNILLCITIALFIFAIINIYKLLGYKGIIPFLFSILASKYIPLSMCLTFFSDIILMLLAVNFFAIKAQSGNIEWKKYYVVFSFVGAYCAYLGYWAFPLITLGIPLVFITAARMKNADNEKDIMIDNIGMSVFWGIGLCATVIVKQVLCYLVLGSQNGTSALIERMGAGCSLLERVVSTRNVILRAMSDGTVMFVLIVALLLKAYLYFTNKKEDDKYGFYAFLLIASYPIIWCLVLTQHNMHGFVIYMYGVTYYALLSFIFFYAEKLKSIIGNKKGNVAILCVWLLVACFVCKAPMYYDNQKQVPWSVDEMDTINLVDMGTVAQHIKFDIEKPIHLKYIKVILENVSEEDGTLNIVITDNGDVVQQREILLKNIKNDSVWRKYEGNSLLGRVARRLANNSRWSKIPVDCMIQPNHEYVVMYSVENVKAGGVNIYSQNVSQGAPANEELYVNGNEQNATIVNILCYNLPISVQARVYILVISLLLIQAMGNKWNITNKEKI